MWRRTRLDRERDRHDRGADAGGGAQPAEPDRADPESVLGDRGQQRDGAAEQHGHEVERDRAEQHRLAPDEAVALERLVQRVAALLVVGAIGTQRGFAIARVRGVPHGRDAERGRREQPGHHHERQRRLDDVEHTAEHRADDRRELPDRGVAHGEPGQPAVGHEVGRHRSHRGCRERARDPEQQDHQEDRGGRRRVGRDVPREPGRGDGLEHQRDRREPPPVETVGEGAAHQHEQQRRQELDEAEDARARARCRSGRRPPCRARW